MELFDNLAQKVETGDMAEVKSLVDKAIAGGTSPSEVLNGGLVAGMNAIGIKFRAGDVFLPEVLLAARAMKAGLAIVKPLLAQAKVKSKGKIVLGTVKGDMHDIGKNIVCYMLEGAGYDVIDLGLDVPAQKYLDAARREGAQVIGVSSLLTTTMINIREVIDAVAASDLKGKVRVVIGGSPITQTFADEIKADGYAPNAPEAVELITKIIGN
jgi:5-methyltetrahydrofolate--homocysteine methyltransferase